MALNPGRDIPGVVADALHGRGWDKGHEKVGETEKGDILVRGGDEGVVGVSYRLGLRDCREGITTMAPGTSNLKDKHFLTFLRSAGSPSL